MRARHPRGNLYTADWRGGVACTGPAGGTQLWASALGDGRPSRPNGIALRRDGSFLLADLGDTRGGVHALDRDGSVRPVLEDVDGVDLPPSNFVFEDAQGRIWLTVSTRRVPRASAYRADVADGFIAVLDASGARIVADGLGYTNEAAHLARRRVAVRERDVLAPPLALPRSRADGSLSGKEVVTEFGHGTYPDGLAFDADGQRVDHEHREQPRAARGARRRIDRDPRGCRSRARGLVRGGVASR